MTLEISEQIQTLLKAEAERQHTSSERLAEELLQRSLRAKKRDASHLAGTWTDEEVREFEAIVAPLQEVVEDT
jgi:hypothetical protein